MSGWFYGSTRIVTSETTIDKETSVSIQETIQFWLQDECRCITVQSVTHKFNYLTRSEAAQLLELEECVSLMSKGSTGCCEVTRCCIEQESNGRSAVKLIKAIVTPDRETKKEATKGSIYSVCPLLPALEIILLYLSRRHMKRIESRNTSASISPANGSTSQQQQLRFSRVRPPTPLLE